jgi:hypothetical protein
MSDKTKYRVTGAYVLFKTSANQLGTPAILGFHEGATVPADVSEESIAHHLRQGLIEEIPVKAMPVAAPRSDETGDGTPGGDHPDKSDPDNTGAAAVSQGPGSGKADDAKPENKTSSAANADGGAGSTTAGAQPAAAGPKPATRSTGTTGKSGSSKAG